MPSLLEDHRVFWRQFRDHYHTTGAVAPSSRFLGRALARFVGTRPELSQRVLEVGPGTGSVTTHIVRRLGLADTLDLVEVNDQFVRRLNERFERERPFYNVASRARVLHQRLEALPRESQYDVIVSGLPLNNFSVADVEHVLDSFSGLLRPGGVLSFFEYVAIRPARALMSGSAQRARLRGIARALAGVLGPYEVRRDCVWRNLPPAWVHHVRWPGA